jgi:hypothetical protein
MDESWFDGELGEVSRKSLEKARDLIMGHLAEPHKLGTDPSCQALLRKYLGTLAT